MAAQVGTYDTFSARVTRRLTKIESEKLAPSADDLRELIDQALAELDGVRCFEDLHDRDGDDTTRRIVLGTEISGWIQRTSRLVGVSLVRDAGTDDESIEELDADEWAVRPGPGRTEVLHLAAVVPTGTKLRLRWTRPHEISETDAAETTIPAGLTEPLTLLAVAAASEWIARAASDLKNSAFSEGAEMDYEAIADRWTSRGREARKRAREILEPPAEAQDAAGVALTWDSKDQHGRPRVGH